jgi:hypothetical protein
MDKKAASVIAKNPESTSEELSAVVGLYIDVDPFISVHPNISAEDLRELIYSCPLDFIFNPSLQQLMIKDDLLLEFTTEVTLSNENCPEFILRWVAENGSQMKQKMALLLNPKLPNDLRGKLTPASLYEAAIERLQNYANAQDNLAVKKCIENYSTSSRPYCVANFLPINPKDTSHRLGDMVGGFPFTSYADPWPVSEMGIYKQPIVQINLELAGKLLEEDLGSGLLQVWADVLEDGWQYDSGWPVEKVMNAVQIRVIEKHDLSESPNSFYPSYAPWDTPDEELDDSKSHVCLMRLLRNHINNPRINWIEFGRMFQPTYSWEIPTEFSDQGYLVDDLVDAFCEWDSNNHYLHEFVPQPESPFIPRSTYLGGFGGGNGGQNEPYPLKFKDGTEGKLLFNTLTDGDSYASVSLAVYWKRNEDGSVQFEVTYYRYA